MRGFRIGLDGAASTLFLECQDIGGQLQNVHSQNWDISLSDLALSLAPRTAPHGMGSSFNRALRSAFVIIDFKVKGEKGAGASNDRLNIDVTKIHAVMQPSSIGELGDFVDDIQVNLTTSIILSVANQKCRSRLCNVSRSVLRNSLLSKRKPKPSCARSM